VQAASGSMQGSASFFLDVASEPLVQLALETLGVVADHGFSAMPV